MYGRNEERARVCVEEKGIQDLGHFVSGFVPLLKFVAGIEGHPGFERGKLSVGRRRIE